MDVFLKHVLRSGDFAWELRTQRLEPLLGTPQSGRAVHKWLTAAEGDTHTPSRPSRDLVASLRQINGTLECPAHEDPHSYQDPPGGFSRHF